MTTILAERVPSGALQAALNLRRHKYQQPIERR